LSREGDKNGISIEPSHWYAGKCWPSAFVVLGAITFCHLLNDVMQALLPAIYPMLKSGFALSFGQIGLLTLIFQVTASLLQPMVGLSLTADRSLIRYRWVWLVRCMVTLAFAPNFPALLAGAALLGIGSSIFHPESSRLARLASGGARGFAQSFFSSWRPCPKCTRTAIGCIRCPAART
jgi:MFS transporter, FSR family, fosmidomycin resistance protein